MYVVQNHELTLYIFKPINQDCFPRYLLYLIYNASAYNSKIA